MSEKFITIKEVALNNNCPECYSKDGLRLTFKQKFVETDFYKSITKEVSHSIACKTCNNPIYPVQWTDDIERVFEYQKKAFVPKNPSTYLKTWSWILIVAIVIIVIAALTSIRKFLINPQKPCSLPVFWLKNKSYPENKSFLKTISVWFESVTLRTPSRT